MTSIDTPILLDPQRLTPSWAVLPSFLPVPGMGVLAVNAFVLKGPAPMLVDTGLAALGDAFIDALAREIDLGDLRWIWLSHLDADHLGNLERVLQKAPKARVLTSFLGMGKMQLAGLDVSRVAVLEPGACFDAGGRTLVPVRPPYFDAPESIGFFDTQERVLFAVDSFGALLPAPVTDFDAIDPRALRDGLVAWSSIDAPWLAGVDQRAFGDALGALRRLAPEVVISGHLPAAHAAIDRLTGMVREAWCAGPSTAVDPLAIASVVEGLSAKSMAA